MKSCQAFKAKFHRETKYTLQHRFLVCQHYEVSPFLISQVQQNHQYIFYDLRVIHLPRIKFSSQVIRAYLLKSLNLHLQNLQDQSINNQYLLALLKAKTNYTMNELLFNKKALRQVFNVLIRSLGMKIKVSIDLKFDELYQYLL